ncbi:MAG: MFS transporter [Candidatus Nanohaloarchaea archaeon]
MSRSTVLYRFSESEGPVLFSSSGEVTEEERDELESILFVKDEEEVSRTDIGDRKALIHLVTNETPWMKGGGEEYYLLAVLYEDNEDNERISGELELEGLDQEFLQTIKDNWKGLYADEKDTLEEHDADRETVREQKENIEDAFQDFNELLESQWSRMSDIVEEQQEALASSGKVSATKGRVAPPKEIALLTAIYAPIFATAFTSFWGLVERIWEYNMPSITYEVIGLQVAAYEFQLVGLFLTMGIFSLASTRFWRKRYWMGIAGYLGLMLITFLPLVNPDAMWFYGVIAGPSMAVLLVPLGYDFARNSVPEQRGLMMLAMGGTAFVTGLFMELLTFLNPDYALTGFLVLYAVSLTAFVYYHVKKDGFERDTRSFVVHEVSTGNLWLLIGSFLVFMTSSSFVPWGMDNPVSVSLYRLLEVLGLVAVIGLLKKRKEADIRTVYIITILSVGVSVMLYGIGTLEVVQYLGLAVNAVAWGPLLGIFMYMMWVDSARPERSVRWIGIAQAVFYFGGVIGVLTGRYFSLFIPRTTVGFIAALLTYLAVFPVFRARDTKRMKIVD